MSPAPQPQVSLRMLPSQGKRIPVVELKVFLGSADFTCLLVFELALFQFIGGKARLFQMQYPMLSPKSLPDKELIHPCKKRAPSPSPRKEVSPDYQYVQAYRRARQAIRDEKGFAAFVVQIWKYGKIAGIENSRIDSDEVELYSFGYGLHKERAEKQAASGVVSEKDLEAMEKFGEEIGMKESDVQKDIGKIKKWPRQ